MDPQCGVVLDGLDLGMQQRDRAHKENRCIRRKPLASWRFGHVYLTPRGSRGHEQPGSR